MANISFTRVSLAELTMNRLGVQGRQKKVAGQIQQLANQLSRLSRVENYDEIGNGLMFLWPEVARPALVRRGMIHLDDDLTVRALRGCTPGAWAERQELRRHYFQLPRSEKGDGKLSAKELSVLFDQFTRLVPRNIAVTLDLARHRFETDRAVRSAKIGHDLCSEMSSAGFNQIFLTALPLPLDNLRHLITFALQQMAAGAIGYGIKHEYRFPPVELSPSTQGPSPVMDIERLGDQAEVLIYKNSSF